MVRFMKGIALATRWLYENKEPAIDFFTHEMHLKPHHARRGWEYYTQNRIWHSDGDLNLEGMKYNLRILRGADRSQRLSLQLSQVC